jgi:hypothetical protein
MPPTGLVASLPAGAEGTDADGLRRIAEEEVMANIYSFSKNKTRTNAHWAQNLIPC